MTLDTMLKTRAIEQLRANMAPVLDFEPESPNRWTTANRDDKLRLMRSVGEASCEDSVEFMKEIAERTVDGKPLLYWYIQIAMLEAEIAFLQNLWDELTLTSRDALGDVPVDPQWLFDSINRRYEEVGALNLKVASAFEAVGEPEAEELG